MINQLKLETGYIAELASYKKIDDALAACLSEIKGEVLTAAQLHRYASPLEETLLNSRMDQTTLDTIFEAMQESLPKYREFLRMKASLLGHENGLPFYDLLLLLDIKKLLLIMKKDANLLLCILEVFDSLANFAQLAFDNAWIDVYPKEGKVGGTFCSNLACIEQSRMLLNYGNQYSDVVTLAHELGHGFHVYRLKDETLLNSYYPIPLAETASTFCETIIKKAAIKSGIKDEVFSILETGLIDSTQVTVEIYSRYLFESKLIKCRSKKIMIEAQKEAYGDGVDSNYLHPYMWGCKPHYYHYYAIANIYNFPYAFGLSFAKGLYAQYQQ